MSLSLDLLWKDSQAAIRARLRDFLLPAAAFIFLPNFAQALFVAAPAEENPSVAPFVAIIVTSLIALIGTISIIAMVISPQRAPAGAIKLALRRWPRAVILSLVTALIMMVGFVLLILPGFYAYGRLWLTMPSLVVDQGETLFDPVRRSWALTEGSVLRAVALLILMILSALMLTIPAGVASLLDTVIGLAPEDDGKLGLFGAATSALVGTAVQLYLSVFQACAFLQLTGRPAQGLRAV